MATTPIALNLKTMLVPSKEVEVEFPGMPGFKINVAFLARETLQTIRKKSTKVTYKNRQPVEELNDDLFLELYVDATVKGWSGLKISYLEQLAPVDVGGAVAEDELAFTTENALFLMKSSTTFDSFVAETVSDLGNFQKSSAKK